MAGGWRTRAREFFALDDPWVRVPEPGYQRRDVVIAVVLFAASALGLELARSAGVLGTGHSTWAEYAGVTAMSVPIAFRRRWPLVVVVASSLAFFVVGATMPAVAVQLSVQALYFYALFSAMAWATDRRSALIVIGFVLVLMFGWLAWQFTVGSAVDEALATAARAASTGLFGPVVATVLYTFLVNVVYFGGAVLGGQAAWRAARRRTVLAEQAETVRRQAATLREHAVVQERLRIARELHDVVAHHVSVMGVQAGAARRVLSTDPSAASEALSAVESSAREAVSEMRSLLGTLRGGERASEPEGGPGPGGRAPEPSLDALPALVEQANQLGDRPLHVSYSVVAEPVGAVDRVGPAVGLTLYRTVQESLHNVRRHSTATTVSVVLRVNANASGGGFAEVEVLDNGRPRAGTSGTGLGLLGMRERTASLDGTLEVGPRATGGFRVRVRLPLIRAVGAEDVDAVLSGAVDAGAGS